MATEKHFVDLGGDVCGEVVPCEDGDGYRWNCECGESGTAIGESAAAVKLYFHRRSGCQPDDQVEVTFSDV